MGIIQTVNSSGKLTVNSTNRNSFTCFRSLTNNINRSLTNNINRSGKNTKNINRMDNDKLSLFTLKLFFSLNFLFTDLCNFKIFITKIGFPVAK